MSDIESIIEKAIKEINEWRPEDPIKINGKEVLYGEGGKLDSIALVTLVTSVEEEVLNKLGLNITLANPKALSPHHGPFHNVDSLKEYLKEKIEEAKNG